MTDLPDVNVWLAASVGNHSHHRRAQDWWKGEASADVAFCRTTALALVRLLTQPTVMGGRPLAVGAAWQHYEALRRVPEVVLLPEPDGCESWLGAWAAEPTATPRLWADAYLASFARAGGLRLVTFDRDFERFHGLDCLVLTA